MTLTSLNDTADFCQLLLLPCLQIGPSFTDLILGPFLPELALEGGEQLAQYAVLPGIAFLAIIALTALIILLVKKFDQLHHLIKGHVACPFFSRSLHAGWRGGSWGWHTANKSLNIITNYSLGIGVADHQKTGWNRNVRARVRAYVRSIERAHERNIKRNQTERKVWSFILYA